MAHVLLSKQSDFPLPDLSNLSISCDSAFQELQIVEKHYHMISDAVCDLTKVACQIVHYCVHCVAVQFSDTKPFFIIISPSPHSTDGCEHPRYQGHLMLLP